MALPTRIDPMLGYLTTGYHDHVRIREQFGYRVSDAMWAFFKELGVIDEQGQPTQYFGDPAWVYVCYCRRRGDTRPVDILRNEAAAQIAEVRQRGVFIAEGYAAKPSILPTQLDTQIHEIYADAKKCIWAELPADFESHFSKAVAIRTLSMDRNDFILHPTSGEELDLGSVEKLASLRNTYGESCDTVIVLSDGLNALAHTTDEQALQLIDHLGSELRTLGRNIYPELLVVRSGRVRAGYRIGEELFGNRKGWFQVLHVVGERPGSGHRTLSIYITRASGDVWGVPSKVDHNITKVVSGIARTALLPEYGAEAAARILRSIS